MSLTINPLNILIRTIKVMAGRQEGPSKRPANAALGGTTAGPNNYGRPRGTDVFIDHNDLRQWRTPSGTSQERHTTTRLPGDR